LQSKSVGGAPAPPEMMLGPVRRSRRRKAPVRNSDTNCGDRTLAGPPERTALR
jgi:hypothetical protein